MIFDIVIIGGSIAGSTTGYRLANYGHSVLILEKESFPRDKPCGDGLTPKTLKHLPFRLPVDLIRPIYGGTLISPFNKKINIKTDKPIVFTCPRTTLDNFLLKRSHKAGVVVKQGERVINIIKNEGLFHIQTLSSSYSGKILIGADGYSSIVNKKFKINPPLNHSKYHISFAVRGYIENTELVNLTDEIEFYLAPFNLEGYGWLFPTEKGINIGVGAKMRSGISLRKYFHLFCRKILIEKGFNPKKIEIRDIRGHYIPIAGYNHNFAKDDVLLVGDAASLVDGLTGEGMRSAVISGQIAALAINEGLSNGKDIASMYQEMITKYLYNHLKYGVQISRIFHKFIEPLIFFLKFVPSFSRYFYSLVIGDLDYQKIIENPTYLIKKMIRN